MEPRLRALADLHIPWMREYGGRHEYDGVLQDLSPDGVTAGLARLITPPRTRNTTYDAELLRVHEHAARIYYGSIGMHRRNPIDHLLNLDISCYEREYAPAPTRAAARHTHLSGWPDACDAAIEALDQMSAPVAEALLSSIEGLAAGLNPEHPVEKRALSAHAQLVEHVREAAHHGAPSGELGSETLVQLLGAPEALSVDVSALTARAEREFHRMHELLVQSCERYWPGEPVQTIIERLHEDHPQAEQIITETRIITNEALRWATSSGLLPYVDGECHVQLAPPARRVAAAMISWAAPDEPDAPSLFLVTPPEDDWSIPEQQQWLRLFSRTVLPVICVHEVAPGHFSHSRALRHAATPPRRLLPGGAFVEGWAHYAEELALETGFRQNDPRFAVGVALEALLRITRLRCAIGVHSGALDSKDAIALFENDAYLTGPAALSEARRAVFDPTYGRYTWGKIAIRDLRENARHVWGSEFSLARFHRELLQLGSPPLGLMDSILEKR